MASTQLSRAIRQSSRCTPLELSRSITPSPSFPRCRFAAKLRKTRLPTRAKAIPESSVPGGEAPVASVIDDAQSSKLHLPPMEQWRTVFPDKKEAGKRSSIRNPATAKLLAESFVPAGSKDKIIIEASPGPGQLTRALLDLPKERIKKLIVIENFNDYLQYLKPLEELDPRVTVLPMFGKDWATYRKITDMGLLNDVEVTDWNQVHPQLQFIMHMTSGVDGEQLSAQLLRTIPDRQWLYQYGRVPLNFILTARMWERIIAPESVAARCKVSVMAQSVSEMSEAVPYDAMQPYSDHFHPDIHNQFEYKFGKLDLRRMGIPYTVANFIPLVKPIIEPGDLDYWDYCVRKLFVQKATPLEKCINSLGPGAYNLLPKLNDPSKPEDMVDLKKNPRSFTVEDWAKIVRAFKNWPFRPEDLGIDTIFITNVNKHT
ncbi:hypothetical protein GALMADRAFT_98120 [Galerina marginata CBS 339.88]|uniref:rRNA adenine N(6)-methyltransferase n=1 Tax=Galerina marginata (strain CBS 339.88) TaxID=685588 RepID=A0A067SVX2_GALM3|nr:hypothetical protein GALMADRAFT_98120 [Galerina marginata CBS 339.88]